MPDAASVDVGVAAAFEQPTSGYRRRDEPDSRGRDCIRWKAASFEIAPCCGSAIAEEFAFACIEERLEQLRAAVVRSSVVDRSWVDAGALRKFLDRSDELFSEGDGAAVEVGGPEHGFAAVDEEAARRGSVGDHALRADAESCVGELLVGRDPAA